MVNKVEAKSSSQSLACGKVVLHSFKIILCSRWTSHPADVQITNVFKEL